MEPPYKRQRLNHSILRQDFNEQSDVFDQEIALDTRYDGSGDDDELEDEEDEDRLDPDFELEQKRAQLDYKLKTRFEAIFEKYGRDFSGVGDEIDLATGQVVVDNGHLLEMQNEKDTGTSRRHAGGADTGGFEDSDEDESEEDDEEDEEEISGSTDDGSDDLDSEPTLESIEDDTVMQYQSDATSATGQGIGLQGFSVPMQESGSNVSLRRASTMNPATLPSEDDILAQFGPDLAPQIIKYVGQQRALENSKVEPAWRTPGLPISVPGKRPLLKTILLQPDSDRSASPEDGTSIWDAPGVAKSGRQRKQRQEFTEADDELIVEWVKMTQMEGYPLWRTQIWRELARKAPHHSYSSYRNYYRRKLFPRGLEHSAVDESSSERLDLHLLSSKLNSHLIVETSTPISPTRYADLERNDLQPVTHSRDSESTSEVYGKKRTHVPYTKEDDALLMDWYMNYYSHGRVGVWAALAKKEPKHSALSWQARYRKFLNLGLLDPSKQSSEPKPLGMYHRKIWWTKEEDAVLINWITAARQNNLRTDYRSIWNGVADQLPGRTWDQLRHRVKNLRYLSRPVMRDAPPAASRAACQLTPSTSPHTNPMRPVNENNFTETSNSIQPSNLRSQRARQAAKQTPGTVSWSEAIRTIECADPALHAGILEDTMAANVLGQTRQQQQDMPYLFDDPSDNYQNMLYREETYGRSGNDSPHNSTLLPSSIPNSESNDDLSSPECTPSVRASPDVQNGTNSDTRALWKNSQDHKSWVAPISGNSEAVQNHGRGNSPVHLPDAVEHSDSETRSDRQENCDVTILSNPPTTPTTNLIPINTNSVPRPTFQASIAASQSSLPDVGCYDQPQQNDTVGNKPTAAATTINDSVFEIANSSAPSLSVEATSYVSPYLPVNVQNRATSTPITPKVRQRAQLNSPDEEEDELSILADDITVMSATPSKRVFKAEKAKGYLKRLFDEARSSPQRSLSPQSSAQRQSSLQVNSSSVEMSKNSILSSDNAQKKTNPHYRSSTGGPLPRERTPIQSSRRASTMQLDSPLSQSSKKILAPKYSTSQKSNLQFSSSAAELSQGADSTVVLTPEGTKRMCGESGFKCGRDFCFTCE